jgi:hypothetical protein
MADRSPTAGEAQGRRAPIVWFIALTVLAVAAALILPPVSQPLDYHDFADQRHAHGIDNFLDVVSNAAFLVFGVMGLFIVGKGRACFERPVERWPYVVFFVGLVLTAAGSAYYHLEPNNETLFWDRLPMTIAFMGLVASQIVDRISVRAGLVLLPPALLIGAASVIYWLITERLGAGNVIPYGILQAYTILVVLLLAIVNPSRYTRGSDIYWVFAWYALAKVLETFDLQVLEFSGLVSGHTLKHFAAAFAGFSVCRMLLKRTLLEAGRQ